MLNLKNNVTTLKKGRKRTLRDSLGNFASMGNPLKSADVQGTLSEQRNRYYNYMLEADQALDRVDRAGTNKNERAYAEEAYYRKRDKMRNAARQYNSIRKRA